MYEDQRTQVMLLMSTEYLQHITD